MYVCVSGNVRSETVYIYIYTHTHDLNLPFLLSFIHTHPDSPEIYWRG